MEKADKLLQFKLKMGDEIRTVVSGIAKFYENPEELVGKKLVLVANLAPKKIRGIVSHGMLLSAATDDDSLLEVLQVAKADIPSGSTVCWGSIMLNYFDTHAHILDEKFDDCLLYTS